VSPVAGGDSDLRSSQRRPGPRDGTPGRPVRGQLEDDSARRPIRSPMARDVPSSSSPPRTRHRAPRRPPDRRGRARVLT